MIIKSVRSYVGTPNAPIVVDMGAHETRIMDVSFSSPSTGGRSFGAGIVLPSLVARSTTKYRGNASLAPPGTPAQVKQLYNSSGRDSHSQSVLFGVRAEESAETVWLRALVDRGSVQSYFKINRERIHANDASALLSHVLKNSPFNTTTKRSCPIVIVDSLAPTDVKQRAALISAVFEDMPLSGGSSNFATATPATAANNTTIAIIPHSVAVLVAHGLDTGLVVDIGETSTRVTPVLNGQVLWENCSRGAVSGWDITEQTMRTLVSDDGYPFRSFAEPQRSDGYISGRTLLQQRVAQFVKEKLCFVGSISARTPGTSNANANQTNYYGNHQSRRAKAINETDWSPTLQKFLHRHGQTGFLLWDAERCDSVAECLFTPQRAGRHDVAFRRGALPKLVASVLESLPPDVCAWVFFFLA